MWDTRFEKVLGEVLPSLAGTQLAPDTSLRTAGLDSLATIELLLRLEEAYGVSLPDEVLTVALRSLGQDFATAQDAAVLREIYPTLKSDRTREA